ncbi:hypothetical protein FVEN_g11427 [Fusarium venenatum]|nr:hypothetical protein FVEN_g11427 [Fusarium venenatum]
MEADAPASGSWGSSFDDYRKVARHHPLPLLNEAGEFHQFIEDLANDENFVNGITSPHLLEEGEDGAPLDAENTSKEPTVPPLKTMKITDIETLIKEIENTCGPPPTIDSLPQSLQEKIQQHDGWFLSIFERIFDASGSTTNPKSPKSLFTGVMLDWMKSNSDEKIRNALLSFLLHPHVRSFSCRAALGHRDVRSLFHILESHTLVPDGKGILNMIGIYFLHGVPEDSDTADLSEHSGYCGQAMSMRPDGNGSVGIRQRAAGHWTKISKTKSSSEKIKGSLHAHDRLAHAGIAKVEISVLTVFPFPRIEMGDTIKHLYFIAAFLVEKLRDYRITKIIEDVKSAYDMLMADSTSGLLSCCASKWRFIWSTAYEIKCHLLLKGLVQDPQDDNDLYYHIPALENGLETSWHIRELLRRTGFVEADPRLFNRVFFFDFTCRVYCKEMFGKVFTKWRLSG